MGRILNTKEEKLKEQINHTKELLEAVIKDADVQMPVKEDLIKLSMELDELIVEYTKWKNQLDSKPGKRKADTEKM